MSALLLLCVLAAPYVYNENGIGFALEQPADWVIDSCNQDSLVAFSSRDGLASLSINVFEDIMWSNALDVFGESTREFLEMGYTLAGKSRLSKGELERAAANDGAHFHYIKRDGEMKEHIIIMAVVHDNVALLITFYLPRWRVDRERLTTVHNMMAAFHFLEPVNSDKESIPPVPPLK